MSEEIKNEEVVEQPANSEEAVMAAAIHNEGDPVVSVQTLLEAGVHLGHPTRKWNPKMKKFIYDQRNNIYIIDLLQTQAALNEAYDKLKSIVEESGKVLFVGTKQQIKTIVEEEAVRSGSFYINNRWLGGTLTNFNTIKSRINYLKDLEQQEVNGNLANMTKKEASKLLKEKAKLSKNLEGIKEMRKVPNALIVVDPSVEYNAIREANRLNIPVFAIVDTNCDPDGVNYVIPGNDDASKSVKLLLSLLADAIVEAKGGVTTVAYAGANGADVNMKDVIKQVEKENAERLARYREEKRKKQEAFEKQQAERKAKFEAKQGKKEAAKPAEKAEKPAENAEKAEKPAPKAPKAPKAEKPAEKPAEKVEAKVEEVKEEVKAEEPKAE